MKIERETVNSPVYICEFAEKHDLTMKVIEYKDGRLNRFQVSFKHSEIKEGAILKREYASAPKEDGAIMEYADKISNKHLVINAGSSCRKDIHTPTLTAK